MVTRTPKETQAALGKAARLSGLSRNVIAAQKRNMKTLKRHTSSASDINYLRATRSRVMKMHTLIFGGSMVLWLPGITAG